MKYGKSRGICYRFHDSVGEIAVVAQALQENGVGCIESVAERAPPLGLVHLACLFIGSWNSLKVITGTKVERFSEGSEFNRAVFVASNGLAREQDCDALVALRSAQGARGPVFVDDGDVAECAIGCNEFARERATRGSFFCWEVRAATNKVVRATIEVFARTLPIANLDIGGLKFWRSVFGAKGALSIK